MVEKIPSPENIETRIEQLLGKLDGFIPDLWDSHPELQEEWYFVEMQGKSGVDREQAENSLTTFIEKLQSLEGK